MTYQVSKQLDVNRKCPDDSIPPRSVLFFLSIVKSSVYSWATEKAHFKTPRLAEISKDNSSGNMALAGQALIPFLIAFSSSWSYFIFTYTFSPHFESPQHGT